MVVHILYRSQAQSLSNKHILTLVNMITLWSACSSMRCSPIPLDYTLRVSRIKSRQKQIQEYFGFGGATIAHTDNPCRQSRASPEGCPLTTTASITKSTCTLTHVSGTPVIGRSLTRNESPVKPHSWATIRMETETRAEARQRG